MSEKTPIGAGHASAMFRLGLREWRNAVNPSRESVADTELGLYGTRTPGEVEKSRQSESKALDREQDGPVAEPDLER